MILLTIRKPILTTAESGEVGVTYWFEGSSKRSEAVKSPPLTAIEEYHLP